MRTLRAFLKDHRRLAALFIAAALGLKALVPAGYMIGTGNKVLTVEICADTQGERVTRQIVIPQKGAHPLESQAEHGKTAGTCAFSVLAFASLAGADGALLAAALLFILILGFLPVEPVRLRPVSYQRPPLRGPPLPA